MRQADLRKMFNSNMLLFTADLLGLAKFKISRLDVSINYCRIFPRKMKIWKKYVEILADTDLVLDCFDAT